MNSRKPESLSQTDKAVKLRNERRNKMSERMFNAPLRAFLEHKYPVIYREYVSLYNQMRTEHPGRKKLVTSETFMRWKANNPEPSAVIPQPCGDILTVALQETINGHEQENDQLAEMDSDTVRDILNQAQEDMEYDRFRDEIDGIINEFVINETVNEFLEQPTEDEGIALNPSDEIHGDIEPFDYVLEVELGANN